MYAERNQTLLGGVQIATRMHPFPHIIMNSLKSTGLPLDFCFNYTRLKTKVLCPLYNCHNNFMASIMFVCVCVGSVGAGSVCVCVGGGGGEGKLHA